MAVAETVAALNRDLVPSGGLPRTSTGELAVLNPAYGDGTGWGGPGIHNDPRCGSQANPALGLEAGIGGPKT